MFSIGEFARFGGISVRMLRHYDETGLLAPARVDPATGYRYYSAHQLPTLNRLLALKGLGFRLDEIGPLLGDVTAEELRGMLRLRRSQLQAEIDGQRERLAAVEARLRSIEEEGHMPQLDVVTKSLPAERVLAVRAPAAGFGPANLGATVRSCFDELVRVVRECGIEAGAPAFCFFTGEDDADRVVYCAVPVDGSVTTAPAPAQVLELPAVELAATAVWQGRMEDYQPYGELARWLEDNGLEHVGAGRDRFLQLESGDTPAIVEIHWPVKGPDGRAPDITPRPVSG